MENNIKKTELPTVFVGQVLFREANRRGGSPVITEHTVNKVGIKYFGCTGIRDKILIKTLRHEDKDFFSYDFQMYRTMEEILDKNEEISLYDDIQKVFSAYHPKNKLSLAQLRNISGIIGITTINHNQNK